MKYPLSEKTNETIAAVLADLGIAVTGTDHGDLAAINKYIVSLASHCDIDALEHLRKLYATHSNGIDRFICGHSKIIANAGAAHGHIRVIEWVLDGGGKISDEVYFSACAYNHVDVAQWLWSEHDRRYPFALTDDKRLRTPTVDRALASKCEWIIRVAVQYRHLEFLQWALKTFPLRTRSTAIALMAAVEFRCPQIFPAVIVTATDAKQFAYMSALEATKRGDHDMTRYILYRYTDYFTQPMLADLSACAHDHSHGGIVAIIDGLKAAARLGMRRKRITKRTPLAK